MEKRTSGWYNTPILNESEIVQSILDAEGMSRTELSHILNLSRQTLWQRLNGQSRMTVGVLEEMLRAMGYRLVAEPVEKNVYGPDGKVLRTREKFVIE